MSTIFSNGLYSKTNLGIPTNVNTLQTDFFSLSSLNNEVVLTSAGTLNSVNLVGVGYNYGTGDSTDWSLAPALSAAATLTVSSFVNGVAAGDAPTTLTVSVSAGAAGLPFALLFFNRSDVLLTYKTGTLTYTADLSASTPDISDPNKRRVTVLGMTG